MFGIGETELVIILLFAFMIFGPDKMLYVSVGDRDGTTSNDISSARPQAQIGPHALRLVPFEAPAFRQRVQRPQGRDARSLAQQ